MRTNFERRIDALEAEQEFRDWLEMQRMLDGMSLEQLDELARNGFVAGPWPEPLPPGGSIFDRMSREELWRKFREDKREFGGRRPAEMDFFIAHGHWPDQREFGRCR